MPLRPRGIANALDTPRSPCRNAVADSLVRMADPHRHSQPPPAQQVPPAPSATPADADAPGVSEAGAWWRQLRGTTPMRVAGAVLLVALLIAALLVWRTHA